MKISYLLGTMAVVGALGAFAACGDDEDAKLPGDTGSNCEQLCDLATGLDCYDAATCVEDCEDRAALAPAACASETDDYFECLLTEDDPVECDASDTVAPVGTLCTTEMTALLTCVASGTGGAGGGGGSPGTGGGTNGGSGTTGGAGGAGGAG